MAYIDKWAGGSFTTHTQPIVMDSSSSITMTMPSLSKR